MRTLIGEENHYRKDLLFGYMHYRYEIDKTSLRNSAMHSQKDFSFNGHDAFNLFMNAFFAFLLVCFSIVIPDRVSSEAELDNIRLGLPIAFISQDISFRVEESDMMISSYPTWIFLQSPWEIGTEINPFWFWLDVAFVWTIFLFLYRKIMTR